MKRDDLVKSDDVCEYCGTKKGLRRFNRICTADDHIIVCQKCDIKVHMKHGVLNQKI